MNLDYISNVLDQFYLLFTESFTSDYFVVLGIFFIILGVLSWMLKWGR